MTDRNDDIQVPGRAKSTDEPTINSADQLFEALRGYEAELNDLRAAYESAAEDVNGVKAERKNAVEQAQRAKNERIAEVRREEDEKVAQARQEHEAKYNESVNAANTALNAYKARIDEITSGGLITAQTLAVIGHSRPKTRTFK